MTTPEEHARILGRAVSKLPGAGERAEGRAALAALLEAAQPKQATAGDDVLNDVVSSGGVRRWEVVQCDRCKHAWDEEDPNSEVCACLDTYGARTVTVISAGATNQPPLKELQTSALLLLDRLIEVNQK